MAGARTSRSASSAKYDQDCDHKNADKSDGQKPSHFLTCIEMAKLGSERGASKLLIRNTDYRI